MPDTLGVRVASAMVLGTVAITAVILGSPFFELLVVLAAVLMGREWSVIAGVAPGAWPALVLMAVPALVAAGTAGGLWPETAMFALATPFLLVMAFLGRDMRRGLWLAIGLLYIAVPAGALVWMRGIEGGMLAVAWLLCVIWATDIGAYAVGRTVGGALLCPAISPRKTWSGSVGGLVAAAAAGLLFAAALMPDASLGFRFLLALVVGLAVVAGDLLESAIKRHHGVKDSGSVIPGHGGVLDRVDGMVLAVPLVASYELLKLSGALPGP